MIPLSLADIAEVTGGRVGSDTATVVTGAAFVDSRAVVPGGLFGAIAGANVDGHDFAAAAVEAGAAAVICSKPVDAPHVIVDDVTEALGTLAAHVVRQLDVTTIGVTGSAGKTSVKDLIASILEKIGPTVSPVGSFNNDLGVPLTVLKADESTQFLVVEMGARGPGHIARLCAMVPPRVGVVTNVGSAHLGEFGDIEATARAKSELVAALPADGVAVLNSDDARVAAMAERTGARILTFGTAGDVGLVESSTGIDGTSVVLAHEGVTLSAHLDLIGDHVGRNAAAAVSAVVAAGVPFADAMAVVEGVGARSPHRMARHELADGTVLIDDTFNANPDAMAVALHTLAALAPSGRVAVLGEMLEMGAESAALHREVGALATELGIEHVIAVGDGAAPIAVGAGANGVSVPDVTTAIEMVTARLPETSVVLVKASRGVRLERVVDGLLSRSG